MPQWIRIRTMMISVIVVIVAVIIVVDIVMIVVVIDHVSVDRIIHVDQVMIRVIVITRHHLAQPLSCHNSKHNNREHLHRVGSLKHKSNK